MDKFPTEIVSAICSQLSPIDITNVRLVSRFLCNVSTPFLLQGIHLIFTESSFQRLTDISKHPIVSREVTSLFYEPDCFRPFRTREQWEDHIMGDCFLYCETMDECSMYYRTLPDAYFSDTSSETTQQLLIDHLANGWATYHSTYAGQQRLRNGGYGSDQIYAAMSKFPNLTSICMSLGSDRIRETNGSTKGSSGRFRNCRTKQIWHDPSDPTGINQMQSLLLGASFANLSLLEARFGSVQWRFFQATDADFETMKKPLKLVRHLELRIVTDDGAWESGNENLECYEYLRSSMRMLSFIKDAPMIETLIITFDSTYPHCPSALAYVVGSTKWNFLTTVDFQCLDTDEDSWVEFCSRHRKTLREVRLEIIRLTSGRWASVLQIMHNILTLTSTTLRGCLLGTDPPQYWPLDYWGQIEPDDMSHQCNRTRIAVQEYLVDGGNCPLLDEERHPQTPLWKSVDDGIQYLLYYKTK